MEDLARYLDEFVEPVIKDFADNPTSVRHAFVACVVAFHSVDYLAYPRRSSRTIRQQFGLESPDFAIVDRVAHAFKHVITGNRANPNLRSAEVIARPPAFFGTAVFGLSRWDDLTGGVTLEGDHQVDLLDTLKRALIFLCRKAQPAR